MPLIAIAVASYALGLIFGFADLQLAVALGAMVLVGIAWLRQRGLFVAAAALLIAGDAVAVERTWHDAACLTRLATRDSILVVLAADADSSGMVRGVTDDDGCHVRAGLALAHGRAGYGATVVASGKIVASADGLFIKPATITVARRPGILATLRSRARRAIERDFGTDAPLAKALLIADMADLGPDVRNRFANAGLVHILSISGLHVTIVATAMLMLLEAARLPKRYALIAGCVLTSLYVALIGAPPPAVRSAVMFGALATSRLLQRPTSSWAALALGAGWPLAADARVAIDVGWQLTVAGMVALIVGGDINKRYIDERFSGWRHKLIAEVCTGVIATIVTAPIVAWYFGRMSLVAPIANIGASPVANLLQPTLFLSLALGWWPAASSLVADAARPGLRALDGIAGGAAALPGANVSIAPTISGAILASIAVLAAIAALKSAHFTKPAVLCLCAIGGMVWLPLIRSGSGELELHVIDVGQADAIAVRTPRGRWIVVDGGGAWRNGDAGRRSVVPYLRSRGGDVILFVLTHPHLDHVGGASSILEALRPSAYWDGAFVSANAAYRQSLDVAARRRVSWQRVHPGDSLRVDGVLFRAMAPDSAWTVAQDDPNNASTVIMVEYGTVRFLLTGDAEAPEEAWMLEHWGDTALRADLLKAGHHGSKTSSSLAFLDAVRPRVAVVSVGAGNTYGLPSPSVMAEFARRGILTLRTDEVGSITVSTDGHRLRVAGGDGAWVVPP